MTTNDSLHPTALLSDYALSLLPAAAAQQIGLHLAQCAACRAQVERERQIGRLVQQTLAQRAQPDAARLARLMPGTTRPLRNVVRYRHAGLQRGFAAIGLALFLLLGNLGRQQAGRAYASPEPFVALATAAPAQIATQTVRPAEPVTHHLTAPQPEQQTRRAPAATPASLIARP